MRDQISTVRESLTQLFLLTTVAALVAHPNGRVLIVRTIVHCSRLTNPLACNPYQSNHFQTD